MEIKEKKCLAVKVLPRIWIGGSESSKSTGFFKEAEIGAVLNMTPKEANHFCYKDIEYLRIPVYDSTERRDVKVMYAYLPVICEFLYKNTVLDQKNVLVHCHMGQQRSATAVAAYLIKYYKMTPHGAMQHLLKYKSDVFAKGQIANFASSLNKWYKFLQNP